MKQTKITALYERLSHDDELQGESNSMYELKHIEKKRLHFNHAMRELLGKLPV